MACKNPRPHKKANAPAPPFPGAAGWLEIKNIGSELVEQFGQVTHVKYTLEPGQTCSVDRRDAVYILGSDLVLVA